MKLIIRNVFSLVATALHQVKLNKYSNKATLFSLLSILQKAASNNIYTLKETYLGQFKRKYGMKKKNHKDIKNCVFYIDDIERKSPIFVRMLIKKILQDEKCARKVSIFKDIKNFKKFFLLRCSI